MCFITWSRKVFLPPFLALVVGGLVFVAVAVGQPPPPVTGIGPPQRYSYMVAADGVMLGTAQTVEGGAISATVQEGDASGSSAGLHLVGRDEYSDVVVQYASISPAFAGWMNDIWDSKKTTVKNLRIACISPSGTPVWDRTYEFASVRELIIQQGSRSTVDTPNGPESRVTQPGKFIVKFQYGKAVDSTGPFPSGSGAANPSIHITDFMQITLDGGLTFSPSAYEPISILRKYGSSSSGKGMVTRTIVSRIAVSVPFTYANGLLTWAKTGLPAISLSQGKRNEQVEKNGAMTWKNDRGETTCTLSLKNVGVSGYEYTSDSETNPLLKVNLYCEEARLLTTSAAPPGPPTTPPTKKATTLRSTGTPLGTPRKLGGFEITVKSAEYVSTPMRVVDEDIAPSATEKTFIVTYTLRNASTEQMKVDSGTTLFQALDSSGATYQDFKVGIGTRMARISGSTMAPGDTLTFSAVTIIPAEESIVRLRITGDAETTEYTFANP